MSHTQIAVETCAETLCGLYNRTLALQAANATFAASAQSVARLDQLRDVDATITRYDAFPDGSSLAAETAKNVSARPPDGAVLTRHDGDTARWRAQPPYAGGPRATIGPVVHSTLVRGAVTAASTSFGTPEFGASTFIQNIRPPFRRSASIASYDDSYLFAVGEFGLLGSDLCASIVSPLPPGASASVTWPEDVGIGTSVSFTWICEAHPSSTAEFLVDGTPVASVPCVPSTVSATTVTPSIAAGARLLEFRYTQGVSSGGSDQVCVSSFSLSGALYMDLIAHQVHRAVAVPDGRVLFVTAEQTGWFTATLHVHLCDTLDCTTSTVLHSVTGVGAPVDCDVLVRYDSDALDTAASYRVYLAYAPLEATVGVTVRYFDYELATATAGALSTPSAITLDSVISATPVHAAPALVLDEDGLPVVFFRQIRTTDTVSIGVVKCVDTECTSVTDRSPTGSLGSDECGTAFGVARVEPNGPGGGTAYRDAQGRPTYVTTTRCMDTTGAARELLLMARCPDPTCSSSVDTGTYTAAHTLTSAVLSDTNSYRWPHVTVMHRRSSVVAWVTAGKDDVIVARNSFPLSDLGTVVESSTLSATTNSMRVDGAMGVGRSLGGDAGNLVFVQAFESHGGVTHLLVVDESGAVAVRACATQQWTATEVCGSNAQHAEWVPLPFRVETVTQADGLRHGVVRVVPMAADGTYLFLFNCVQDDVASFREVCTAKCFDPYCAGGVAPSANNQ